MKYMRFGLYDAIDPDAPVKLCGDVFDDSESSHRVIAMVLKKYRRWAACRADVTQCVGLFPVKRRKRKATV